MSELKLRCQDCGAILTFEEDGDRIEVYKSAYERCVRYGCLMVGQHAVVCGGSKRKRSRKIQECLL